MSEAPVANRPAASSPRPKIAAQRLSLFDTPVVQASLRDRTDLIDALKAAILQRKAEDGGVRRSNVAGWHSDLNMTNWGGPPARELAETAMNLARQLSSFKSAAPEDLEWVLQMWANVSGRGAYNLLHVHPATLWAAVLYVDVREGEGPDRGGEFFVEDPRFPLISMHPAGLRMLGRDGKPEMHERLIPVSTGDLIIFPAWLRHGVKPYFGEGERISIAMNITVTLKPHPASAGAG